MNFFISDTHFGHENILAYDGRPWKDTAEMETEMVKRWNQNVSNEDDVWMLGDIIWTKDPARAADLLASLNGKKHLILGNHDQVFDKNRKMFVENEGLLEEIVSYKEIQIPHVAGKIVLCHYPINCFNGQFHGFYHFYGHVHNSSQWKMTDYIRIQSEQIYQAPCRMINVGCMMDYMDYAPQSFERLCAAMEDLGYRLPGRSGLEAENQEDASEQVKAWRNDHVTRGRAISTARWSREKASTPEKTAEKAEKTAVQTKKES